MEKPNISYIEELSGGDESFKTKILDILKEEFPEEKKSYKTNLNSGNFELTADNVHKLKHKISILGLDKSYEIAVAYEDNLREGSTALSSEFESILQTITNYLENL